MANDCLVTKFKGSVNNENLKKLGVITIECSQIDNSAYSDITSKMVIKASTYPVVLKVVGNGAINNTSFLDLAENPKTEITIPDSSTSLRTVWFSNGNYKVEITNKYNITELSGTASATVHVISSIELEDLAVTNQNVSVFSLAGAKGDVTKLRNSRFKRITPPNSVTLEIHGDVTGLELTRFCTGSGELASVYGDFTSLLQHSAGTDDILYNGYDRSKPIYIDLSCASSALKSIMIKTAFADIPLSWKTTRPSDYPILVSLENPMNLGDDLDAMLINQANCSMDGRATLTLMANGTRTSASDAAVATLKGKGCTVVINGETL